MNQQPELGEKYKKPFRKFTRVLVWPSVVIACVIFYDLIAPASNFDQAVITRKNTYHGRTGINYNIQAKGNFDYNEKVSKQFYNSALIGDTINVALSRFFAEWKSIELIRNDKVIIKNTRTDIYYMGIFGLLFLVPLLAFLPKETLFSKPLIIVCIPILELLAVALCVKFILVLAGVIEKM
jgi:hypothetical protein